MPASERDLFKRNLNTLKKYHPQLLDLLDANQEQVNETKVVETSNRRLNLQVKTENGQTILIHDPHEPGREAEHFLSMVPEHSTGVVLMFGMGLGYSVRELLRQRQKLQYLVVFELNIEFFNQAMTHMDLSDILSDPRLILCLKVPENLHKVMVPVHRALMLEDIHTLSLMSCAQVNNQYDALGPVVADYISAFNADGNTKLAYGRTFIENRLKHLTSMHQNRKMEELAGQFKDVPALIVAAGPSLDKNIDQIQRAKGKSVILCVDSALPALLAKKIVPDFVTSIDYQELTWEKVAGVAKKTDCRDINLICTTWVTDLIPKQLPAKQVFWAFSRTILENWINGILGGKIGIGGAGTVAHLNFVSANLMGCDPIIFVGQDLAFSDQKGHSANVVISADQRVAHQLKTGQDIFPVKGVVTPQVPTNRQMQGYRRVFEKMIQEANNKVVNSTEGGAFIEGADHMPLSDAIATYCDVDVTVDIEVRESYLNLRAPLESVLVDINKAARVIKKAEKLSVPIKKKIVSLRKGKGGVTSFVHLPEPIRKKISDLDSCHDKLDGMPLFSIFDEITMKGLRQNEREKKEIENIKGDPDRYLEWMWRSLERVDKINDVRTENLSWFKKKVEMLIDYYQREQEYLNRIEKEGSRPEPILGLAELYYSDNHFVRLEKVIRKHEKAISHTPEFDFYQGVIHLVRRDFKSAERLFAVATRQDVMYEDRIAQKRSELGDFYFVQARERLDKPLNRYLRHPLVEQLLFKAFQFDPNSEKIRNEIKKFSNQDFKTAAELLAGEKKGDTEAVEKLLEKWVSHLNSVPELSEILGNDIAFRFYVEYAKLKFGKQEYKKAIENYQLACNINPQSPDLFVNLCDLCFQTHEFEAGLAYLKKAVELDKNCAVYWRNMGDNLKAQQDFESAIFAYEQYFLALPENITILKEIGDCYKKMGNLEAAYEAFALLKQKLSEQ